MMTWDLVVEGQPHHPVSDNYIREAGWLDTKACIDLTCIEPRAKD